jgi:peptidoglycan hydrolase-like protein with peptidoglycan-binding domain
MARIDPAILPFLDDLAKRLDVEAAALCAVVEVEGGSATAILYEKHKFPGNIKACVGNKAAGPLIAEAKRQGLAVDRWLGRAQYKDQRSHAATVALLNRARKIHDEAATRSASYGAFQVLGSNFKASGFDSAIEMRAAFDGGLPAQIEGFINLADSMGVVAAVRRRDWKTVALKWNGKSYAENLYDKKLASAYARWAAVARANSGRVSAEVARPAGDTALRMGDKGPRVAALQEALAEKGYAVKVDRDYGPATKRAVSAAQVDLGLIGTGVADHDFVLKLEASEPIVQGARALATSDDLKAEGSSTIEAAQDLKKVAGGLAGGAVVADQSGLLDQASSLFETVKGHADKLSEAKGWLSSITETIGVRPGVVVCVIAGVVIWYLASRIIKARVADHRAGLAV